MIQWLSLCHLGVVGRVTSSWYSFRCFDFSQLASLFQSSEVLWFRTNFYKTLKPKMNPPQKKESLPFMEKIVLDSKACKTLEIRVLLIATVFAFLPEEGNFRINAKLSYLELHFSTLTPKGIHENKIIARLEKKHKNKQGLQLIKNTFESTWKANLNSKRILFWPLSAK